MEKRQKCFAVIKNLIGVLGWNIFDNIFIPSNLPTWNCHTLDGIVYSQIIIVQYEHFSVTSPQQKCED